MTRWGIAALWLLFVVRGAVYCVSMPLWEGWDEYAHFAWLDRWMASHTLPRFDNRLPHEVERSLRLAPLPDELRWMGAPRLVYEQWWALPEKERAERFTQLHTLTADYAPSEATDQFYEAQQPPLYYWLTSLPLSLVSAATLTQRVLIARLFSLLLASFAVPFTWLTAKRNGPIAAALIAVAPGFAIDTFRVANDGLAIALFSICLCLLLRARTQWWLLGLAAGCALLTKAYMLVLLPLLFRRWRALMLAVAISGWWYVRNLMLGHSITGWLEHATISQLLHSLITIHWFTAVSIMAKSFTWFGGWSFLTVKSWIYTVIELTGIAAIAFGVRENRIAAAAAGLFAWAMLYAQLVYDASHPGAYLPGWYFWPAAPALAVLAACAPKGLSGSLIGMLAALDIYGFCAVSVPYYAGLLSRGHANISLFIEALRRLPHL